METMSKLASHPIRFNVEEYLRMSDAGIFGSRKTELIAGRIIKVPPQKHPHFWAISRIARLLINATTPKEWVVIEGTLYLDPNSAPEPDFHLFDVPEGTPSEKLPLPILVIEVSHKTYKRDSGSKLRLYAKAGIQDYWIVNLKGNRVEVYRKPEKPHGKDGQWRYASVVYLKPGQNVALLKRPKMSFPVAAMLP